MSVKLNTKHLEGFVKETEFDNIWPQVELAHQTLTAHSGPGSEFLGWTDLPIKYDKKEFARIRCAAQKIRSDSDILIVIGIGGSYLGARAAIEAMTSALYNEECTDTPKIYFCGNSVSSSYLTTLLRLCKGKRVSVNIISK
ncbi:MAG: glucose-6-phosphate isomerase, partial [Pygmaiobacter sp.]